MNVRCSILEAANKAFSWKWYSSIYTSCLKNVGCTDIQPTSHSLTPYVKRQHSNKLSFSTVCILLFHPTLPKMYQDGCTSHVFADIDFNEILMVDYTAINVMQIE